MGAFSTVRFILNHPLASRHRGRALGRYLRWQLGSRLDPDPVVVDFVNDARLLVRPGMTGATGNVYVGLHEFEDMAFVLHALRPADLFVDVGANVGSYTVLAAKGIGARCAAFEPVPAAFAALRDNVRLNAVDERVEMHMAAVGHASGTVRMTIAFDTGNRVVTDADPLERTIETPMLTLDDALAGRPATIVKIDVEGFEQEVVAGARQALAHPDLLAVLMETNRSARARGSHESRAHDALLGLGFQSFVYEPFERRLRPLHGALRPDANTLYLRDPERTAERLRSAPRFRVHGHEL